MAVLEAYFDETGHGSDPLSEIYGIIGCLEQKDSWIDFEKDWITVLEANGLSDFHMKDFAQSRKAFEDWKEDEPRREKLSADLWNIIQKTEPVIFGCFVDLEGYRGRLGQETREILGDVHYFCFLHCLKFITKIVMSRPISNFSIENVSTIFDDKKGFTGKVKTIFKHTLNRFPELQSMFSLPDFQNVRKAKPLQVADIVAYEVHKEIKEQFKEKRRKKRFGFEQLEILLSKNTLGEPFNFGDVNSPIAFYSKYELAKITVAMSNYLANKNKG